VNFEPNGSISYVYLFSAIAIFILCHCLHQFHEFINCPIRPTGQRSRRSQGHGFPTRSIDQSVSVRIDAAYFLSFILAVMIALFFSAVFNTLADRQLILPLSGLWFYGLLLGASLVVALLAGLYPAFVSVWL